MHQLSPDDKEDIIFREFLILVFYIYEVQTKPNFDEESEVNDITIDNIKDISEKRSVIAEGNNLIRIMLEDYENGKKIFQILCPKYEK